MQQLTESPPTRRRSFWRDWFPLAVLGVAAPLLAYLWLWPAGDRDPAVRSIGTILVALFASVLVAIWLLFFSRVRGWRAALVIVVLLAFAGGAVREVKLTGDWVPMPIFRWDPAPATAVEASRKPRAAADSTATVGLAEPGATDFPEYRGRDRDGVIHGPPLARDWQGRPPRLLWRRAVGGGYASVAVVGDAAVTLEQRGEQEAVVCYDAATGDERWAYTYPAHFSEWQGGSGPRATPTIAGGDVFSLGAAGQLVCLEGGTGREKWSVNVLTGNDNVRWGMSGSPLVYDQFVVVNAGAQKDSARGGALVAFDRATGKRAWAAGDTRAGYSSPMLATLAGRRQIVLFDGAEVAGYDPAGAGKLWAYPWKTMEGINAAQPLIIGGDSVFVSSGYGVGCALLRVTESEGKWAVKPRWSQVPNKSMQCKFSSPVARDGYVYGLDNGTLACLDLSDGSRKWKSGRYGHGETLLADDLLVILAETGDLVLVEANPSEPRELGKVPALTGRTRTWNYPALADGKAYVRNDLEMACYDLR